MFIDDFMKVLLGGALGTLIALGLCWLPRYRGTSLSSAQAMPWHYHAVGAGYFVVLAIASPPVSFCRWMMIAAACVSLLWAVCRLRKQRVQFTLRSLFLATLLVAMILSAGYYLTVTAVLAFVTGLAMEWIRLEECRHLTLPPPQDRGEEVDAR